MEASGKSDEKINVGMFISKDCTLPYNKLLVDSLKEDGINLLLLDKMSSKWFKENRGKIDVIHIHWPITFYDSSKKITQWKQVLAFIYFILLIKKHSYKLVWTVHNVLPHDRSIFPFYLGNLFLTHFADALILHAHSTKKELKKYFGYTKDAFVIPYTNYTPYSNVYSHKYSKKKARKELGLPPDKFIYMFFGYIRKYKGIDIAIRAFQKAKPKNSLFVIAGSYWSDEEKAEIVPLIQNDTNIIASGEEITGKKVQQHMSAADVIVLPYKKITTSGVLVLALTFGKPIIGMKKGMVQEWVSDKNGILVETEAELENALIEIQKKDLNEMSNESFSLSQKYNWPRISGLYEEVYKKILHK